MNSCTKYCFLFTVLIGLLGPLHSSPPDFYTDYNPDGDPGKGISVTKAEKASSADFRYFYQGDWVALANDPTRIAVQPHPQVAGLPELTGVTNRSRHAGRFEILEVESAQSAENISQKVRDTESGFVSPVMKDPFGGDIYVERSSLLVVVAFEDWIQTISTVIERLGGVAAARVLSSPVGTEHESREYFAASLPDMSFREPRVPYGSILLPDLPYASEVQLGNGNVAFELELPGHDGWQIFKLIDQIVGIPGIVGIEPPLVMQPIPMMSAPFAWPPNDPDLQTAWHLWAANGFGLDIQEAWEVTFGYSSIKVGLLDSGVETFQPDLHLAPGQNFVPDQDSSNYEPFVPSDPEEFDGGKFENHATALAGVISAQANNDYLATGVAPGVRVVPLRMYYYPSGSSPMVSITWFTNAINWAAEAGCRVTNASLGLSSPSSFVTTAYNNTRETHNVVHVAASGNGNTSPVAYPSSLASVMSVGAINQHGDRWTSLMLGGSNYGNGLSVVAPGASIFTTDRLPPNGHTHPQGTQEFTIQSGTSLSSPMVAALAALILSKNPRLTPQEVEDVITGTALDMGDPGFDIHFGHGLIRPRAALDAVSPGIWIASGAMDTGGGWKYHPVFKHFIDEGSFPFYYHEYHGWQYAVNDDPNQFWIYDTATDIWWLTDLVSPMYPQMLRDGTDLYYYLEGSSNPRWFYHYDTLQWYMEWDL